MISAKYPRDKAPFSDFLCFINDWMSSRENDLLVAHSLLMSSYAARGILCQTFY